MHSLSIPCTYDTSKEAVDRSWTHKNAHVQMSFSIPTYYRQIQAYPFFNCGRIKHLLSNTKSHLEYNK